MRHHFVITGPDGAGKSTTTRAVALRLGQTHRIVQPGPSRPVYAVVDGQIVYPFSRAMRLIHGLHHVADRIRLPALVGAVNVINVLFCARVVRPFLIRRVRPDLVLAGRDVRVDPAVYSRFYVPFCARLPLARRMDLAGRLVGSPASDVVFFLTVDPEEAIRRIDARILAEHQDPEMIARTRSSRWRHLHEHPDTLRDLQDELRQAFRVLSERSGLCVHEIDTSRMPQAQVVDYITSVIVERLRLRIRPS